MLSMRLRHISLLFLAANLVYATGPTGSSAAQPASDEQAVAAATADWYAALNAMFEGNGEPMKMAWSHADDASYMGPGGNYLVGWKKIGAEWETQTAAKLGGHVTPTQIHTVVGTDLAVVNCIESGENIVDGKKAVVDIRSSTVFRKEDGAWKAIGHQTDLLGFIKPSK